MTEFIRENKVPCPNCGKSDYTDIRKFNLMFKTFQGVTEDTAAQIYLRPETAQGIFVNFKNVQRSSRKKVPFGIAQIGKAFRNEITPGNFIFRTREFEQMELEFFCKPGTNLEWFEYWRNFCYNWLISLGMKPGTCVCATMKRRACPLLQATTDFEFCPARPASLYIADRADYDLRRHQGIRSDMSYFDPGQTALYLSRCRFSVGVRAVLLLVDAYDEEVFEQDEDGR